MEKIFEGNMRNIMKEGWGLDKLKDQFTLTFFQLDGTYQIFSISKKEKIDYMEVKGEWLIQPELKNHACLHLNKREGANVLIQMPLNSFRTMNQKDLNNAKSQLLILIYSDTIQSVSSIMYEIYDLISAIRNKQGEITAKLKAFFDSDSNDK